MHEKVSKSSGIDLMLTIERNETKQKEKQKRKK